MNQVMIDIETLGVRPGCIVLSIGMVEFDSTSTGRRLCVHIDRTDSETVGLTTDASTLEWWAKQSPEAQAALHSDNPVTIEDAYLEVKRVFPEIEDMQVWCNGAAFDFPITTAMFQAAGLKSPWKYYNERDMRTIKGLVGKDVWNAHAVQAEVAHSAIDDAIAQAMSLQNVLAAEGLSKWLK